MHDVAATAGATYDRGMLGRWLGPIAVAALTGCPTLATDQGEDGGEEHGDSSGMHGDPTETDPSASGTGPPGDTDSHGEDTGAALYPHVCVAAPPPEWIGPVALLEATAEPCPDAYPEPIVQAFAELAAAPAECGCACDAQSLCGELVGADLQSACDYPTDVLATTSFPIADACTEIPALAGAGLHLAFEPDPGATCAPESTATIPEAVWSRSLQVCAAPPSAEGCASAELCAPVLDEDTSRGPCIVRPGVHECPSEFPVTQLGWTGIVDDRDCSACECAAPDAPTTCTAKVRLSSLSDCSDASVPDLEIGAFTCVPTEGVALEYLSYTSVTAMGPGCAPSGGRPIGTAQPADAFTICCAG